MIIIKYHNLHRIVDEI